MGEDLDSSSSTAGRCTWPYPCQGIFAQQGHQQSWQPHQTRSRRSGMPD